MVTLEPVYVSLPFGDGYAANTSDDPTENHFTGKERDTESGNDYFLARYYNSATGRFLSPDWSASVEPVPYAKLGDPQTLNLYSYVGNNPMGRADVDGHCYPWCTIAAGALVGGVGEIIDQKITNPHADINWKSVGAAAAGGAVAGATMGILTAPAEMTALTLEGFTTVSTSGAATTIGAGAVGGVVGGVAEREINTNGNIQAVTDLNAVVKDSKNGALGAVIGGSVESTLKKMSAVSVEKRTGRMIEQGEKLIGSAAGEVAIRIAVKKEKKEEKKLQKEKDQEGDQ